MTYFQPYVNLLQGHENRATWGRYLRGHINECIDAIVCLILARFVVLVKAKSAKDLLYVRLNFRGFRPWSASRSACYLEFAYFRVMLMPHEHLSSITSVPIFPSGPGWAGKVGIVVLHPEVLSERQEDVKRELVVVRIRLVRLLDGEATKQQHKCDRYVNRTRGCVPSTACWR